jgi:hypothetical protein
MNRLLLKPKINHTKLINHIKLDIVPSHLQNKKFNAIYSFQNIKPLIIPFGQKGYSDFTTNHSEKKRDAYIKRHQVREDFNNPFTKGSLSFHILWQTDNLNLNIKLFKEKFGFI